MLEQLAPWNSLSNKGGAVTGGEAGNHVVLVPQRRVFGVLTGAMGAELPADP